VAAAGPVRGEVSLPGSKSLTNRYLTCAALARGQTQLSGVSLSDDSYRMIEALRALGVGVVVDDAAARVEVNGCGGQFPESSAVLNLGDAGTAMRFTTAMLAAARGEYRVDGSPRMRERPIGELVDALRALGARVSYAGAEGFPPLEIQGAGLAGGEAALVSPRSSQYLSALLMAAPLAMRDVYLRVEDSLPSEPYVNMTLGVMESMGVSTLALNGRRFVVAAPQPYRPGEYEIEPDASGACYFWAIAAATGGAVRVRRLIHGSSQGDVRFVDVLAKMGCQVEDTADGIVVSGPAESRLLGIDVDLNLMPDTVQTLAALALTAQGATTIRNVGNLRIKETDRIAALATELRKLGATVVESSDGLAITPPRKMPTADEKPIAIDTYKDHRMAMSFAVVGLRTGGLRIRDAGCVSKSLPEFFELVAKLTDGRGRG
jgi:3-phosphoshikimate 1-carboxyvinyltransferase